MLLWKFEASKKPYSTIEDLIRNLNWVLNSKKGFSHFVREFGIGDYNAYQNRQKVIETILEEIKKNFQLFEPRVELIDIRQLESDLSYYLKFEIRCRILESDRPIYVIFDSISSHVALEMEQ